MPARAIGVAHEESNRLENVIESDVISLRDGRTDDATPAAASHITRTREGERKWVSASVRGCKCASANDGMARACEAEGEGGWRYQRTHIHD